MNFERKTSQKTVFLSETQEQKLEKICQKFSSWRPFPSGPLATGHIYKQFQYAIEWPI